MLNPCSASYKLLSITVNQLALCVHKSRNVPEETMIFMLKYLFREPFDWSTSLIREDFLYIEYVSKL